MTEGIRSESPRVLIVDDDPGFRQSLARIITRQGCEVYSSSRGEETLSLVRQQPFDVIFLDIQLPDLDGLKLLPRIKQCQPDLETVVVSGHASRENAIEALNQGAAGYVTKPLDLDDVLNRLQEILHRRRLKQENKRLLEALKSELLERTRAEEALRENESQLRALAVRLADAEERERMRLSHELHDRVGQSLAALGLNLGLVKQQLLEGRNLGDLPERIEDATRLVEIVSQRIRNVMYELRPDVLDDYGFLPAVQWYARQFEKRTGIQVVISSASWEERLDSPVETALFRITQEALTNTAKHAHAGKIQIELTFNLDRLRLSIVDDGTGFDSSGQKNPDRQEGLGLGLMQERARSVNGQFTIDSRKGVGTSIVVEIPVEAEKKKAAGSRTNSPTY